MWRNTDTPEVCNMFEKYNMNHRPARRIVECGGTQIHQKYAMNMSEKYNINHRPARHVVECGGTQIHQKYVMSENII